MSRYYADNRYLSPDDRSTDTIDLNLRVAPAYRIGQHRISALLGMSRYDARGSNFDKIGGSFAASYAFQHKQWLTTLRSGYALLEYPDSTDGRQDRRLTASIGTEFAVNAKHRVGGALAYEENFPSYTDSVYAYRRILAGVNYRGTFFEK